MVIVVLYGFGASLQGSQLEALLLHLLPCAAEIPHPIIGRINYHKKVAPALARNSIGEIVFPGGLSALLGYQPDLSRFFLIADTQRSTLPSRHIRPVQSGHFKPLQRSSTNWLLAGRKRLWYEKGPC